MTANATIQDLDREHTTSYLKNRTFLLQLNPPDKAILHPSNGSGVGLKIGERLFVLTAAHCLVDRRFGQLIPTAVSVVHPMAPRPLPLREYWVTPQNLADNMDLGVIELIADAIPAGIPWLQVSDLSPHHDSNRVGVMIMAGYPGERISDTGQKIQAGMSIYALEPIPFVDWSKKLRRTSSQDTHIHLRFNRNIFQELDGIPYTLKHEPYGISGGAIWAIQSTDIKGVATFRPAAIATFWMKEHQCIRATRIEWALGLLIFAYPELKGEIERQLMLAGAPEVRFGEVWKPPV